MKLPIRITNTKRFCVIVIIMAILLVFYLLAIDGYYQNTHRVHPDEVEVRNWIARVQGSFESQLDPERHITKICLNKSNVNVTDTDIIRLTQLSCLRNLDLSNTNITDDAIPTILNISSLRYVTIKNTKVTSKGIWRIMTERPDLALDTDTPLFKWNIHPDEIETRDWITCVRGSVEYQYNPDRHIILVDLCDCNIADDDLIRLKQLSRLKTLRLSNTDITDNAIPTILSIKSLHYLTIKDTKITREGVKRMYKEREMSIEVTFREDHPDESDAPPKNR